MVEEILPEKDQERKKGADGGGNSGFQGLIWSDIKLKQDREIDRTGE